MIRIAGSQVRPQVENKLGTTKVAYTLTCTQIPKLEAEISPPTLSFLSLLSSLPPLLIFLLSIKRKKKLGTWVLGLNHAVFYDSKLGTSWV